MDSSWIAPLVDAGATVVASALIVSGVLLTIRSSERQRSLDRLAESAQRGLDRDAAQRRALGEHRHDDERAAIAARQAIRDRDFERIRALLEPVMAAALSAGQGWARDDGDMAYAAVDALIDAVVPKLQLERDSREVVSAIIDLRAAAIGFRVGLETMKRWTTARGMSPRV